jgi:hypothetical protein
MPAYGAFLFVPCIKYGDYPEYDVADTLQPGAGNKAGKEADKRFHGRQLIQGQR